MTPEQLAHRISRTPPGQSIQVSCNVLQEVAPPAPLNGIFGPRWNPADRIMEHIAGSAYEWTYHIDHLTGYVTFTRLPRPLTDGSRTYVSPDRRDLFQLCNDGYYRSRTLLLPIIPKGLQR